MSEPRLEVNDPLGRRLVVINKQTFSIGRRSSNDLHDRQRHLAQHAEIVETNGRYIVRDRGSSGGTLLNGGEITRPLEHGDRISIGRTSGTELVFLVDDASDSAISGASVAGGFRQVAALLDALRALGSSRVLDEVLLLVMDTAIEVTGAERGFIMLADQEGHLELKLARMRGKVSMSGSRFDTSRKIPEQVFATGETRFIADLRDGSLAEAHGGTIALGIRNVLCVPLRLVRYVDAPYHGGDARAIGVLYLDSREKGTILSETARTGLETLAAEARRHRECETVREAARKAAGRGTASPPDPAVAAPQARKNRLLRAMGASARAPLIAAFFEHRSSRRQLRVRAGRCIGERTTGGAPHGRPPGHFLGAGVLAR
jgi:pSer/pThr/pTyr-binding forkhead associated (FHA) protein